MKQGTIKKAVIPVAGLGTRFYPITKVIPKELLPIVDKPALLYVIEEAVSAGIDHVILINNPAKALISEESISKMGDETLKDCRIEIVFQNEPMGLGHAVLCAKEAVGSNWFAVLLPDMLIDAEPSCTAQLINVWRNVGRSVIATEHAPKEKISQYGIIAIEDAGEKADHLHKVSHLVEKPRIEDAPSDLFISGRYILPPTIFNYLEETQPGSIGEIQITDALSKLAKDEGLYAYEYSGVLHDIGEKIGFVKAGVYFAERTLLRRP